MSRKAYAQYANSEFNWLGKLPNHWSVSRIGANFRQRSTKVSDADYPALSVTKNGVLPQLAHVAKTDDNDNRKLVRAGDFVINSRSDRKGSSGISDFDGSVSLINIVLEIGGGFEPRYCHHLMRSSAFQEEFYRFGSGLVADLWSTNFNVMKGICIPMPPLEEQAVIAAFLDRETARIDGLIEKKDRFIALLTEKRAALIAHAVTKGIDANAPMKDSGEDWLGQIPAHWSVAPPTVLFTESKMRAREDDQLLSATQKYGVIPLADFEAMEQRMVTMAVVNLDKRKHVELGDFVISMRSMDGGLEIAKAVGSVRSSYSVLKYGTDVESRFFAYLLKSSLYIQALRQTTSFIRDGQDMNFSHFRKVRLPCLPVAEQARIADHIDRETTRIDALVARTERSIELLKEKRAALITAAVTGKIDVRSAA